MIEARKRVCAVLASGCAVSALIVAASATSLPARATGARKVTAAVFNHAARTPPMGIDDWYQSGCNVTQRDILSNAHALVSTGLAADGYDYVILDDCWMARNRSATGALQPRRAAFPRGIAWLARQLHAMGLKLGIYESAGTRTCRGYPGSYRHYRQDAETFADWGVNYVKLDLCGMPKGVARPPLFSTFGADLRADNPKIVYSQELPVAAAEEPGSATFRRLVAVSSRTANLWRVTPDESDRVPAATILDDALHTDLPLGRYAGPGHWNDLDLLVTGNTVFDWSTVRQESQLSIWAEMSSPLIVSANLATPTAVAHLASRASPTSSGSMLANKALIAIDQDPAQGKQAGAYGTMKVVVKRTSNGGYAVLVADTAPTARAITVPLRVMGIPAGSTWHAVWSRTHFVATGPVKWFLHGDGTVLYQVTPPAPVVAVPAGQLVTRQLR